MTSPQPTDSHTRISNELYTQILMRDFSKRQRAILDLIIRLSYGCGKKTAFVPQLRYFEVCGVHRTKITKELTVLQRLNVVGGDIQSHEYWIVKDYDQWLEPAPNDDVEKAFGELLRVNLSYQKSNSSYQNGNHEQEGNYQNGNSEVAETVTEELPKRQPVLPENAGGTKAQEVPITNDNYLARPAKLDTTSR